MYLYYLSIAAVLIGFLYSRALLSIGQISIAAVWLLEGDLREKIRRLKEDKLGVFLAGLYLIHVIWLLNTSNFIYAGEDLRIKLPLLLFPIVFSSTDILDKKSFKYVLYLFVSVILSSTIVISVNYLFHGKEMKDIREASFLISHIRLALMICLSIAVLIYYASKEHTLFRIVAVAIVFWFALYMFLFVYLTGIILLSILLLCMLFWFMRKRSINQKIQRGILLVLILSFGFMAVYMLFVTMDYYQANKEKNVADLELHSIWLRRVPSVLIAALE